MPPNNLSRAARLKVPENLLANMIAEPWFGAGLAELLAYLSIICPRQQDLRG
jgi:hypothetical protein